MHGNRQCPKGVQAGGVHLVYIVYADNAWWIHGGLSESLYGAERVRACQAHRARAPRLNVKCKSRFSQSGLRV